MKSAVAEAGKAAPIVTNAPAVPTFDATPAGIQMADELPTGFALVAPDLAGKLHELGLNVQLALEKRRRIEAELLLLSRERAVVAQELAVFTVESDGLRAKLGAKSNDDIRILADGRLCVRVVKEAKKEKRPEKK